LRDGEFVAWMQASNVAIHRIRGFYSAAIGVEAREFFDSIFAKSVPIHIFGDFEGVTAYETALRERMTEYTHAHRASILGLHYLVGNKTVAMGVSVFGLQVTGTPVYSYSSRALFDAAIVRACEQAEVERKAG
jgi:hypothetical protein